MKQIFIFKQHLMNGTVTMNTQVAAFISLEVAEKTKHAVMEANKNADLNGMSCFCENVEVLDVYESEEEVPILNR